MQVLEASRNKAETYWVYVEHLFRLATTQMRRIFSKDDKEVRTMLAATSPVLQMLNEKVDVLSLTPEERKLYESRMKLKSDIATISEVQFKSGLEVGFAEGEVKGRSEGSHQKALETAQLMKQANCEIPFIAKMTGLTQAEVESICNV